jgi:hypothetical protein
LAEGGQNPAAWLSPLSDDDAMIGAPWRASIALVGTERRVSNMDGAGCRLHARIMGTPGSRRGRR